MSTAATLIKETMQKEFQKVSNKDYDYANAYKQRLIDYRKEKQAIIPLEKPSNIPRAKELGYKAKPGIKIVRARIRKGSGLHRRPNAARRPKRMGVKKLTRRISIQGMAEQRASRKYRNLEVLNSYKIAEDGKNHYFEIILVDPVNPSIKADSSLKWVGEAQHKGRAFRGKTSAQKKSRGLKKGKNYSKNRPSLRANNRLAK